MYICASVHLFISPSAAAAPLALSNNRCWSVQLYYKSFSYYRLCYFYFLCMCVCSQAFFSRWWHQPDAMPLIQIRHSTLAFSLFLSLFCFFIIKKILFSIFVLFCVSLLPCICCWQFLLTYRVALVFHSLFVVK